MLARTISNKQLLWLFGKVGLTSGRNLSVQVVEPGKVFMCCKCEQPMVGARRAIRRAVGQGLFEYICENCILTRASAVGLIRRVTRQNESELSCLRHPIC